MDEIQPFRTNNKIKTGLSTIEFKLVNTDHTNNYGNFGNCSSTPLKYYDIYINGQSLCDSILAFMEQHPKSYFPIKMGLTTPFCLWNNTTKQEIINSFNTLMPNSETDFDELFIHNENNKDYNMKLSKLTKHKKLYVCKMCAADRCGGIAGEIIQRGDTIVWHKFG